MILLEGEILDDWNESKRSPSKIMMGTMDEYDQYIKLGKRKAWRSS